MIEDHPQQDQTIRSKKFMKDGGQGSWPRGSWPKTSKKGGSGGGPKNRCAPMAGMIWPTAPRPSSLSRRQTRASHPGPASTGHLTSRTKSSPASSPSTPPAPPRNSPPGWWRQTRGTMRTLRAGTANERAAPYAVRAFATCRGCRPSCHARARPRASHPGLSPNRSLPAASA